MRKGIAVSASLVALAVAGSVRAATPVVYSNTSNLLPNTANQIVQIYVAGTDAIQGESLNFQINDGSAGPIFTGVNILTGTIFSASNTGQNYPVGGFDTQGIYTAGGTLSGHIALVSTTTVPGFVTTDNGLLATLLISTTSSSPGTVFTLNMLNTLNGPSVFGGGGSLILTMAYPHNQFSIGTADRQWKTNGNGSWVDSNFTPFAPYARGDIANFSSAVTTGTAVITLDGVQTLGTVNFNNAVASYDLEAGSGGILRLDNGTSSALIASSAGGHVIGAPVVLTNDTCVSVSAGSTLTLSGGVSGTSKSLSVAGSGKLLLLGSNSYGATSVASGATLQVGTNTASGSVGTSPINNSGTVTLRNLASPLAVPLTGAGTFVVDTLAILKDNSYANTSITSAGTYQIGDGGTVGTLVSGAVSNGGNLTFYRSDNATHGALISGGGTLTQMGSGTTTLMGAASYSGPTIISAGKLNFSGGVSHSIAGVSGGGALAVDSGTSVTADGLNMPLGSLNVAGNLVIRSSATPAYTKFATGLAADSLSGSSKLAASGLTITGALDIKNNVLILEATDATSRQAAIVSAAGMLGTKITSSAAASNSRYTLAIVDNSRLLAANFGGVLVDPTSVILTEALKGDANMDGVVNTSDLLVWKANFNATNAFSVSRGDFNADGIVNTSDLLIWKANFNASISTSPAPSDGDTGGLGTLSLPVGTGGTGAVPEPASLAVLALGAVGLLARRRRSSRLF